MIPGRILREAVARQPRRVDLHIHAARAPAVSLHRSHVDSMRLQGRKRLAAKRILADAADHGHASGVAGKLCGAAGRIGRRAAKPRTVGKHVPEDFTKAYDQLLHFIHSRRFRLSPLVGASSLAVPNRTRPAKPFGCFSSQKKPAADRSPCRSSVGW